MLTHKDEIFSDGLEKIYYIYSFWQQAYDELQKSLGDLIIFVKGFRKTVFEELNLLDQNENSPNAAIIFDDVLETMLKGKDTISIFSVFLHHMNLCGILSSQNLMNNSNLYCSIMKQANYLLIFESVHGRSSLKALGSQVFGDMRFLPNVMNFIRKTPRGFMVLDLHPAMDKRLRVWQNLSFSNEDMYIFVQ